MRPCKELGGSASRGIRKDFYADAMSTMSCNNFARALVKYLAQPSRPSSRTQGEAVGFFWARIAVRPRGRPAVKVTCSSAE
jgi:hypothetical protein